MTHRLTILVLIAACLLSGQAAYGATFGNTAAATATSTAPGTSNFENGINGAKYTLSEAGIPTSMTASVLCNTANKRMRMQIYRASDTVLMVESEEITVTADASRQTVTANFLRIKNLAAADYWLTITSEAAGGGAAMGNSATSGGAYKAHSGGWAYVAVGERAPLSLTPIDVTGFGISDDVVCIYCTYTPGTVATFGHELRENGFSSTCENDIRTSITTSDAVNFTADTMIVWLAQTGGGSGETPDLKGAIYRVSDDSLMDSTAWITYSDGDVQKWYTLDFLINRQLSASTAYNIAVWSEASTTTTTSIQWKNSTGEGTNHRSLALTAWPGVSGTTNVSDSGLVSMYVKYTEVAAASSIKGRRRKIIMETSWKNMEQRFLWPHCRGMFAGSISDLDIK